VRLIKKYRNRRLYDTGISSYITLNEVRELVLRDEPFEVVDAKTGQDITRNILLQIIIDQEEGGEPILSTETLRRIVRFYGDDLQAMMSRYLDRSLTLFIERQERFREQMQRTLTTDPVDLIRRTADANIAVWSEMQQRILSALGATPQNGGKRGRRDRGD